MVRTHVFVIHLTHWGRVLHICAVTIIASDNYLSPGRRQAIIWTSAGILIIGLLETNFSEISIEMQTFSFKKMRLKVSSAKWRPFCLDLNVLRAMTQITISITTLNIFVNWIFTKILIQNFQIVWYFLSLTLMEKLYDIYISPTIKLSVT